MDFRPLNDTERRQLVSALRGNAENDRAILMDRRDTSFVGVADEVPDEEVIVAIKSVPCPSDCAQGTLRQSVDDDAASLAALREAFPERASWRYPCSLPPTPSRALGRSFILQLRQRWRGRS